MVVLHLDRMAIDERQRLLAMLADDALVEVTEPPVGRSGELVILGIAAVALLAFSSWPLHPESGALFSDAALATVTLALGVFALATWVSLRRTARAQRAVRHRIGRFLHRFGYVEVEPDVVRIAPGSTLRSVVLERRGEGVATVSVELDDGRVVSLGGRDLEPKRAAIEAVTRSRWMIPDGYRALAPRFSSNGPERSRALVGPVLTVAIATLAIAVAWAWVLPARAFVAAGPLATPPTYQHILRAFALPWVEVRARDGVEAWLEQIRDRIDGVREPWRSALHGVLARVEAGEPVRVVDGERYCDAEPSDDEATVSYPGAHRMTFGTPVRLLAPIATLHDASRDVELVVSARTRCRLEVRGSSLQIRARLVLSIGAETLESEWVSRNVVGTPDRLWDTESAVERDLDALAFE